MRKDITATIDGEGLEHPPPLIPVLRESMVERRKDIPPSIIKYLGRNPNVPSLLSDADLAHAVGALECIDPSWYPNTPKEWEDFNFASNIAKVFSQTHGKDYKACMDDIRLMAVKGQPRWGSIKAGLYALGGSERVRDVGDWHQQVLLPCLEAGLGALVEEQGGAFDDITRQDLLTYAKFKAIAGMTMQAQLTASNLYHEAERLAAYRLRLAGIELKKPVDVSQPTWHPLAAPMLHRHSADEQTFAFCVTDKEGLVTLADVQGHCVCGYDTSCITGRSHIVALMNHDVVKRLAELPVAPPPSQTEIDALAQSIPQGSYKHHAENQKLALMKWQAANHDRVKTFPELWEQYVTEVKARGKRKDEGLPDVTPDLLRLALDAAKYHNIPDLWKGISTVELADDNAGNVTQRQHQGYPNRRGATPAEAAAIGAYRAEAMENIDLNAIQAGRMAMIQAFPDRYRPYGQQQTPLVAFDWRDANQRNHIFQAARSLLASDADRNASNPLTWARNRRLDEVLGQFLGKQREDSGLER
ncbi:MAG: hypothetical protein H6922_02835 [Pseudomonadaceae bacterium]|nr:hypothetical protein [Pseudomonadaceae bacterium]